MRVHLLLSLLGSAFFAGALAACSGEETDAAEVDVPEDPNAAKHPAPDDVGKPPSDALKTESGLAYKITEAGSGVDTPADWSRVTAKYTVWTQEGTFVDSNDGTGRIANFAVREAPIAFLKEAIPLMRAGGKGRFWVPQALGYQGQGGKPDAAITVDLEIVTVVNPPKAPEDVAAIPADAIITASGLAYKVLKPGTGEDSPSKWARITMQFTGWQTDGTIVETTTASGRPQMIKLTENAMPGMTEAVTLMHRSEKIRVWMPEALAHGGAPDKPKGMLVYDIDLLSFDNPVPPPDDVAAAPADAKTTATGLAYKVLASGRSSKKPVASSIVEVNYTGWTTDGNMFDSTTKRNKPMRFAASQVIPGWTEGLQLMSIGDKYRFWIPKELAYNDQPGKPAGMLVFDVEVIKVEPGPEAPPDVAAAPASALKTESGVAYVVLKPGTGEHPIEGAKAEVDYSIWTTDGKLVDSTLVRGESAKFPIGGAVPKGLLEGVMALRKGERARLWIPAALASTGRPGGPEGDLVFDLTLVDFQNPPPPIAAPADVAAPPAEATKTPTGLAMKVQKPGTGTEHPTTANRVRVHYTGWTTDGKMFDSSVQRGEPAEFGVTGVIAGWTEGLQKMVVGETTRLWIPVELAYNNAPNKPAGMLVFDVELLEILPDAPMVRRPQMPPKPK